ncbi:MAG: antitoxin [Thermoprotei archaeon]|nr:MAG: antitoxin [Thermoprotei archaeon]
MVEIVEAVYEDGVLKPLEKPNLREGERVKVYIVKRSQGLSEVIRRISKEYEDVKEDPLDILLKGRR